MRGGSCCEAPLSSCQTLEKNEGVFSNLNYPGRDQTLEESDSLPDRDVLAHEIVVPRLASLGTTPSQGTRPGRGPRRGVEDLEALEQLILALLTQLIPVAFRRLNHTFLYLYPRDK